MKSSVRLQVGVWALTILVVFLALYAWWPSTKNLNAYTLFPVFGLLGFSLMWTHYIAGALRRYFGAPADTLRRHFQITGYFVLFFILTHPFILEAKLFQDGLGLPYKSLPIAYPSLLEQAAILAGMTAFTCFLLFELYRFFKNRSWWKYVEWANVAAMGLILWHGFTLGSQLRQPWFQIVWLIYAITFVAAVAYSEYHKRKEAQGTIRNT